MEWINAKDKLPKEGDRVLFVRGDEEVTIATFSKLCLGGEQLAFMIYADEPDEEEVLPNRRVFWMPLPSHPT